MAKNNNLHTAKKARNDEFYTMLTDIEKEMRYYKDFFKGKVVYCNCDDARESNFFKYFSLNFEFLGLKKLITTGYKADGKGVVLVYEGDKNGNRRVDNEEIIVNELNGDGDFRSEECIEYLKQADVVVTNPPFSLFRQYVQQLMDYDGVMGVPITFLDKYCPTQFEIIDINPHFFSIVEQGLPKPKQLTLHNVGKKDPYARILIRKIMKQINFGIEFDNIFSEVKLKIIVLWERTAI